MSISSIESFYDNQDQDDEFDPLFEQLKASLHGQSCGHCGKIGAAIPCHGNCGHSFYCSHDCLVFSSSTHRHACLSIRESQTSDTNLWWEDDEDDDDLPLELNLAIDAIVGQLTHKWR
ncbi:unnamed protein product [Aphanomyces euteiches]|uniref:MYND-type domain-containing protein n=1 Tax=Aphanomyces euteiches TaxID=100861 RepID=A0A6G0W4X0_9STRA|nr:hypothetical protein Ae201684_018724 [Aphanomyces euteiches]KAH9088541.1 hypothetical protein Ae201684P_017150 [Aphanomyces euteiches]KAH9157892.1 hypothetical protein AeRB84_000274 [Aphanomyces euteiches]